MEILDNHSMFSNCEAWFLLWYFSIFTLFNELLKIHDKVENVFFQVYPGYLDYELQKLLHLLVQPGKSLRDDLILNSLVLFSWADFKELQQTTIGFKRWWKTQGFRSEKGHFERFLLNFIKTTAEMARGVQLCSL